MKKPALILMLGLVLGLAAYAVCYFGQTRHILTAAHAESPELAWLRMEFGLDESSFRKVKELHEGYLPDCAEMCGRIEKANRELEKLALRSPGVTPEIQAKLREIGDIRQQCQERMLRHFYAVSQTMEPEQGRRYMREMHRITSLSNARSHKAHSSAAHGH